MKSTNECSHPQKVEIYFGIFKCSACGAIWDEADDETKEHRGTSQSNAIRREERKQAIIRKKRYG